MPRTTAAVCFAGVADAVHDAGAAVCRRLVGGTSGEPSHELALRLSRRGGPEDLIDDVARRATPRCNIRGSAAGFHIVLRLGPKDGARASIGLSPDITIPKWFSRLSRPDLFRSDDPQPSIQAFSAPDFFPVQVAI